MHTLVIKMLMAGLDQQFIDNILTLTHSVVPHSLQMPSLVREALEMSLSQLRYLQVCVCVYVCVCVCICHVCVLISDNKCPNKESLLAISNILETSQKR